MGDAFGRKRIFTLGIVGFTAASLLCGVAPEVRSLIAARVVQGVGGALMIPGALAMISTYYSPAKRGRAIGLWSACSVLFTALGPVVGGLLAGAGLWRWVFFINLPLAATALTILFLKVPPGDRRPSGVEVDWLGAVVVSVGLAAANYALIRSSKEGLGSASVAPVLSCGLILLVAFVYIERRAHQPLLPLSVFRSPALAAASLQSLLFFMAFHGMLFFLPLNLIQVQGYSPAQAGLTQLPLLAFLILLSPLAGRIFDRQGPRMLLTIGPLAAGLGFLLFSWPELTRGPKDFALAYLPGLLLVGGGLGLTAAPLSTTVMTSMRSHQLGLASGINSTLSRLAGVLAIALLGPLALAAFGHALETKTAGLALPNDLRVQLRRDAVNLAETRPPNGLNSEQAKEVEIAVRLAFVETFRVIAKLAALLSGLAALVAFLGLRHRQPCVSEG